MLEALKALLRSRKFLLAVFGLVQAITLHYASVPDEIWQAVVLLVLVVIAGVAYEDGMEKHGKAMAEEQHRDKLPFEE